MTPLSRPACPIFHRSARRIETSSRLSPASDGKIATTTWLPVCSSSAAARRSRRSRAAGLHTPAESVVCPLGAAGGGRGGGGGGGGREGRNLASGGGGARGGPPRKASLGSPPGRGAPRR